MNDVESLHFADILAAEKLETGSENPSLNAVDHSLHLRQCVEELEKATQDGMK